MTSRRSTKSKCALVVFALLGLLVLVFEHGISLPWPVSAALVSIAAVLFAALALPLLVGERRLASVANGVRRLWVHVRRRPLDERARDADRQRIVAARRALSRGGCRGVVLGTALRAGFDVLSLYLLFVAAGYDIALATMMAGYGLPQVVGRVVPGGIGVVEGGMLGLYSAVGVPTSIAVVVVLAYRVLSFWLPLLIGIPLAILEQRETNT